MYNVHVGESLTSRSLFFPSFPPPEVPLPSRSCFRLPELELADRLLLGDRLGDTDLLEHEAAVELLRVILVERVLLCSLRLPVLLCLRVVLDSDVGPGPSMECGLSGPDPVPRELDFARDFSLVRANSDPDFV